jgi:hypothetical protein
LVLDNIAGATAATANDLNYITNGDNGMMQIELAAANLTVGRMRLTITDAATHVPVCEDFEVLPAQQYDSLFAGTDVLQVHAVEIANDLITAAAMAADAGTEFANAVHGLALAELSQAQPSATPTLAQALMLLYMHLRNGVIVDTPNGELRIRNAAGTVICKAPFADAASVMTMGPVVAGP